MLRSTEITAARGWKPFRTALKNDIIRAMSAAEGVADRLRVVAFAELQARDAFAYGVAKFAGQAPAQWLGYWEQFAVVEDRHAQMLLTRMDELSIDPGERVVSDKLFKLCTLAHDPVDFLFLLSSAEERGMEAGFILGKDMQAFDPVSAKIFQTIAEEEVEHVKMANDALAPFDFLALKAKAKELNRAIV